MILIISPFTLAIREHVGQPDSSVDFLVDKWDRLDHKDQRSDTTRASYINNNYNPADGDWSIVDEEVSSMCLSYGASTTNDWFRVARGMTLEQYNDFVNGESRNGTNPRELQSIYYEREKAHPIKYFFSINFFDCSSFMVNQIIILFFLNHFHKFFSNSYGKIKICNSSVFFRIDKLQPVQKITMIKNALNASSDIGSKFRRLLVTHQIIHLLHAKVVVADDLPSRVGSSHIPLD